MGIGGTAYICFARPQLTTVGLVITILIMLPIMYFGRRIRDISLLQQPGPDRRQVRWYPSSSAMKIVRSRNQEAREKPASAVQGRPFSIPPNGAFFCARL
jgi:ATP-binding cassette subfamily B protein